MSMERLFEKKLRMFNISGGEDAQANPNLTAAAAAAVSSPRKKQPRKQQHINVRGDIQQQPELQPIKRKLGNNL